MLSGLKKIGVFSKVSEGFGGMATEESLTEPFAEEGGTLARGKGSFNFLGRGNRQKKRASSSKGREFWCAGGRRGWHA